MIRITTNGTLRSYKSQLMNSTKNLNDRYNAVLTGRRFNAYSEDPVSATQAFRLRSSLATNAKQTSNNDTVVKKFSTAWDIIGDVHEDLVVKMGKVPALSGSNGTNLSVLPELGQVLSAGADAIVQDMNAKYGDNFIFGGADTLKVPFEFNDKGELLYRGQDVDTMEATSKDPNANTYEKIDDKLYVDVGLGFQEGQNGGGIISSSAYDSALNGLDFLGYGTDGEGLPNNVVSIMKELGGMFQRYDTKNNTWGNGDSAEKAQKLMNKLEQASDRLNKAHVELDAKTTFLKTNQERLTATGDNLNEQVVNVEDVDPAQAIMELVWAQQAYNAALKVGTNIIPQSLLDYMN